MKNKLIRHQHYVERYKTSTANSIDPYIRRVDKVVRDYLSKASLNTGGQLARLQRRLNRDILEIYREWTRAFPTQMVDFAVAEAVFLDKAAENTPLTIPSRSVLRAAITTRPFTTRLLREELAEFTQSQVRAIKNAISTGFYEGQSNQEMIRQIRGTKANNFRDGLLSVGKRKAERMVRTAINHTASQARVMMIEENSDIFDSYEWVATLDSRTSHICRSRDGNVYTLGKGPVPPAHPNCRSTILPILS